MNFLGITVKEFTSNITYQDALIKKLTAFKAERRILNFNVQSYTISSFDGDDNPYPSRSKGHDGVTSSSSSANNKHKDRGLR